MRNGLFFPLLGLSLIWNGCDKDDEPAVEHDPPVVTILSPAQDSTVGDTTAIQVDGADYAGGPLDRFVYYVDNTARYTDPAPGGGSPASVWYWPTQEYADGYHELRVVGYDLEERSDADFRTYSVANEAGVELATGIVSTGTSGVISTPRGARLRVPVGAVPRDSEGREATVVFSIESVETVFGPPHSQQVASVVYKFGPSGFTFARPVEITVPLLEEITADGFEVSLYRINPGTGQAEDFAGSYAYGERSVSAQAYHLSDWALGIGTSAGASPNGQGCVYVDNQTGGWLYVCVEDFTLSNPAWDALHAPELGWQAMFAPDGESWPNAGDWWLPRGTYSVCVQIQDAADEDAYTHQSRQIEIGSPAGRVWGVEPVCSATISGLLPSPPGEAVASGPCLCIPEPTIPVGTGDIQVTLTWWNTQPIDLDLWVIEPNGDRCYFANPLTNTGGELDRDNLCANYEDGRPENIFWGSAPVGTYEVLVHWWSDCGYSHPSQDFEVRVISPGYTNTFSMNILPNDTARVTEFTVGPGAQQWPPHELRTALSEAPGWPATAAKPDLDELKARFRQRR